MPPSSNQPVPSFLETYKKNLSDLISGFPNIFRNKEEVLHKKASEESARRVMGAALKVDSLAASISQGRWPNHKDCDRLSKLIKDFQREAELDRMIQTIAEKRGLAEPSPVTTRDLENIYLGSSTKAAEKKCEQSLTI